MFMVVTAMYKSSNLSITKAPGMAHLVKLGPEVGPQSLVK